MNNKLHWVRGCVSTPSPNRDCCTVWAALSRKGRGRKYVDRAPEATKHNAWANHAFAYSRLTAARNAVISRGDFK